MIEMMTVFELNKTLEKNELPSRTENLQKEIRRRLEADPDLMTEIELRKNPKILIVDDDIDSLEQIRRVLRKFDCDISHATNLREACEKMDRSVPDIIFLDWILDHQDGQSLIERWEHQINHVKFLREKFHIVTPKIVTYSGLERAELRVVSQGYFQHVDHWKKPISQQEISKRTLNLFANIGFQK